MAFSGMALTHDAGSSVLAEDVSDLITMISPIETPALDYFGDSAARATNITHSWLEDDIVAQAGTVNEDLDDSETVVTLTSSAMLSVYDIIMVDDELMQVTAIDGGGADVTCTRGYGTSAATTHSTGVAFYKITTGNLENADVKSARSRSRTVKSNYVQIIEPDAVSVSLAQDTAAKNGGVTSETNHQLGLLVKEALLDLERSIIYSSKHASAPAGADASTRTMEGIRWWASTNVEDASSATLTEDMFSGYIRDAYVEGARDIDFCLAPAWQKYIIDRFKLSGTRWTDTQSGMKVQLNEYQGSFSQRPIRVILSPWLRNDELIFGSSDLIKVVPFIPFQKKMLPEAGFYSKLGLHGEYTVEVRKEKNLILVKNLSTS